MKRIKIARPDKILLSSLKNLGSLVTTNLYSEQKSRSKGTGEISFIGEKKTDKVSTQLYQYNTEKVDIEKEVEDFIFLCHASKEHIHWLNFHGLHDVELIEQLGKAISLDRITIRQALDTTLRPKVEAYDHYIFFSVKSVLKNKEGGLIVEQLSFILGDNYVISFQEEPSDHFDHIRNKIVEDLGLIRKRSADYLLDQLLDAILDNYFETIETLNLETSNLEKIVLTNPSQESLIHLERMKSSAEMIKKSLSPFKDSLRAILNRPKSFIKEENLQYFQDLTNNCYSAIEEIESTSKSLESLTNIYFSSLSQKMNETMKVLTTVATIFIPLTFIAGIYGMNFENMPELKHPNGYFIALGGMAVVLLGMIVYFKRKKWL